MMQEFYADRVVYRLQKIVAGLLRIIWWIGVVLFGVVFISLFLWVDKTTKSLNTIEAYLSGQFSYQMMAFLLSLPFWLWLFLSLLPLTVKTIRRHFLYPKKSFTNRAIVTVQSMNKIVHHQSKVKSSISYYVELNHPIDDQFIKLEVDREAYQKLDKGKHVQVSYHPQETTILYMYKP